MHANPATDEVIRRLNTYYDAQQRIDEELLTIRHAEQERSRVSLPSPQITGMPFSKGGISDRTANQALSLTVGYYDDEIRACEMRIAAIRAERDWCTAALASIKSRMDRRIIELAYLGPRNTAERERWIQRPTWYAIASKIGLSVSQVTTRASRIIAALAENIDQQTIKL